MIFLSGRKNLPSKFTKLYPFVLFYNQGKEKNSSFAEQFETCLQLKLKK